MSNSFAILKQIDDLFTFGTGYPALPGHKGSQTSKEAADAIAPVAGTLRGKVAELLARTRPPKHF